MRGAEHLEFEAVRHGAMGELFEPAPPVSRVNRAAARFTSGAPTDAERRRDAGWRSSV
jgi:hypothetical protein